MSNLKPFFIIRKDKRIIEMVDLEYLRILGMKIPLDKWLYSLDDWLLCNEIMGHEIDISSYNNNSFTYGKDFDIELSKSKLSKLRLKLVKILEKTKKSRPA